MKTRLAGQVEYSLDCTTEALSMNEQIGNHLKISFDGKIHCQGCQRLTSKSYSGGFCFDCVQTLACCDMCQVKPELCHYDRGTCRQPEWGEEFCFSPHKVYLARSSDVKVGITRENPVETRWMDQGAVEGMVIAEVPDRKTSGLIEIALSEQIHDKTDFRKMLRGEIALERLEDVYQRIRSFVPNSLQQHLLEKREPVELKYPLKQHPEKIKVKNLDKEPTIEGTLKGIKGQYLIFSDFVMNIKAHTGYEVSLSITPGENNEDQEDEAELSLFDLM